MSSRLNHLPASLRIDSPTVPYISWIPSHSSTTTSERSRFSQACDAHFGLGPASPEGETPIANTLGGFDDTLQAPRDPNIVTWENDSDRNNPRNWRRWKKNMSVTILLVMCVVHAFATTAFIPVIPDILDEFESRTGYLSAFVVCAYILGSVSGPLLFAPLSEMLGHVPLYGLCNLLFVGGICGCAVSTNLAMLAGMRFLAGCGGGITQVLALSSIRYFLVEGYVQRIMLMGVQLALCATPAVAPLAGRHIFLRWGWAWIFWITAVMGSFCTVACVALPEPSALVILQRKVRRLRRETHNLDLYSPYDDKASTLSSSQFWHAVYSTIRLLFSPSLFIPALLPAVGFAFVYMVYITLPRTFHPAYRWRTKDLGLPYLGIMAGNITVIAIAIAIATIAIKRHRTASLETKAKGSESRLLLMLLVWPLTGLGLFLYGWSIHQQKLWAAPTISLSLMSAGVMSAIISNEDYRAKKYPYDSAHYKASFNANVLLQSLLGGLIPLFSDQLLTYLDLPYSFYLLGSFALVLEIFPGMLYLANRYVRREV